MNSANEMGPWSRIALDDRATRPARSWRRVWPARSRGHAWENPRVSQTIRSAASVIAGRDGADGLELLVIERSRSSRFLPGYVVFPGGAIDAGDADLAARVVRHRGRGRARVRRARARPRRRRLALTVDGLATIGGWDPLSPVGHGAARRRTSCPRSPTGSRPTTCRSGSTRATTRWRRSTGSSRRPTAPRRASAWWASAARAARRARGRATRKLYWPTYFTLTQLARVRDGGGPARAAVRDARARRRRDVERLPRSTFWQD